MKPSPMDRRFLDLLDRIETDQSEALSALEKRMVGIEAILAQILETQMQPREDPIPSEQMRALLQDIITLSEQLLSSDQVNRVLHRTVSDLHDLLAAPAEKAKDA